jgi:flagellar basal body-associated protein FliL
LSKTILLVSLAFFFVVSEEITENLSTGQEITESAEEISEEKINQIEALIENLPDLSTNTVRGGISLEAQAEKVRNHRYIVVSAVMMMLFVGLCMASVSSLNPE